MFLSSFRRPPSSNNRSTPSRNMPTTTISGTSITRPKGPKPIESKPNPIPRPFPSQVVPQVPEQPKLTSKKEQ